MAVGTLIKTMPKNELFIGLIKEWNFDHDDHNITVEVIWNDCDDTTEIFNEHEDYDVCNYYFYHQGKWWLILENFWKFKQVLEG